MKTNVRTVTIGSALALALAFAGAGCVEEPAESDAADQAGAEADYLSEELVAAVTNLEQAFTEQFVAGEIDREALSAEVAALLAAAPEADRPAIEEHIGEQLDGAAEAVSALTAEEREELAYGDSTIGSTEQALGWGLGVGRVGFGRMGFGGIGAFGFPRAFGGVGVGFRPGFGAFGPGVGLWGARGMGWGMGGVGFGRRLWW